jgi:hypothetical protein
MTFGGKSPRCIKTEAAEGHDYYRSLPIPIFGSVLPSQELCEEQNSTYIKGTKSCFNRAGQSSNGWQAEYQGGSGKPSHKEEPCRNPGEQANDNQIGSDKCPGR